MDGKGMSENKQYENEYKMQAVKLAKKIGAVNAANELQIPVNTLYGWRNPADCRADPAIAPVTHEIPPDQSL